MKRSLRSSSRRGLYTESAVAAFARLTPEEQAVIGEMRDRLCDRLSLDTAAALEILAAIGRLAIKIGIGPMEDTQCQS